MNKKKGFTLIELLVVIAIISILSSVVIASLGKARNNAKDASASATLSQMRVEAEIIYSDTNSYATVCDPGTSSRLLFDTAVEKSSVQTHQWVNPDCMATENEWYAYIEIQERVGDSRDGYCADSTGFSQNVDHEHQSQTWGSNNNDNIRCVPYNE